MTSIDPKANTFGLPGSLIIPIAARSVEAVEKYVGEILERIIGRHKRVNALLVHPYERFAPQKEPGVQLWQQPNASENEARLYGEKQLWVHVDYSGYRSAYIKFGLPLPTGYFLDHVQNREAVRHRGYSHPYLRLCPVRRQVNTSGGSDFGGEGMEKDYLDYLNSLPAPALPPSITQAEIVYADPMDLTKMLNIEPGLWDLNGVRDTQKLFTIAPDR